RPTRAPATSHNPPDSEGRIRRRDDDRLGPWRLEAPRRPSEGIAERTSRLRTSWPPPEGTMASCADEASSAREVRTMAAYQGGGRTRALAGRREHRGEGDDIRSFGSEQRRSGRNGFGSGRS